MVRLFKVPTLMYMFYNIPHTEYQTKAAEELKKRGWVFSAQ